ncbi:MAG: hypothetical protein KY453_11660 [Gemmatimonadetes bacterium]|nr:hypothetical protein [Gemmatimonadota bacterium]
MRPRRAYPLLAVACLAAAAPPVAAQQAEEGAALRVYLDCQTSGCDEDFFRTELDWVDWVRDRQVADVHILLTAEPAGGGGRRFTLDFLGRGAEEGREESLAYTSGGDATDDELRRGILQRIRLGLVPFVADRSIADRLGITLTGEGRGPARSAVADDPWNHWVFTVSMNGFLNGESQQSFTNLFGSLSANRVNDAWKLNLRTNYSRNSQHFEFEDTTVDAVRKDWGANGLVVKSLGPHWSLGVDARVGSSTFQNQDLFVSLMPGVEFNVFPYDESTRRELTLQYLVGPRYFDWERETVFGRTSETRLQESLTLRLDLNQPWGQASPFVNASHYLHDLELYQIELGGNAEARLFQGFSLRVSGSYAWVRDQLHISAAGLSEEEILLRQRQLGTSFRYFTSFGVTYRFGSIFSDVVNPRFGGSRGSVFFF